MKIKLYDKLYNKDGTVEYVINQKEFNKLLEPFQLKWYQKLSLRLQRTYLFSSPRKFTKIFLSNKDWRKYEK